MSKHSFSTWIGPDPNGIIQSDMWWIVSRWRGFLPGVSPGEGARIEHEGNKAIGEILKRSFDHSKNIPKEQRVIEEGQWG